MTLSVFTRVVPWRAWALGLGLLSMGLTACRPSTGQRASMAREPATTLNTPALPMESALDVDAYIKDLLQAVAAKRLGRHVVASEPLEATESAVPLVEETRLFATSDGIEQQFRAGEEIFEMELSLFPGFGDGLGGKPPNMHRVHRGAHGGPDTSSCRSCHHRGGDDGAGEYNEAALTGGDGIRPSSSNERNPPALHGGGALQVLAREISQELLEQTRQPTFSEAKRVSLVAQGVDFGSVTLLPDGRVDTSELRSIDADLIVRPFGWKGTHATLRRFAEEAFQVHHGMQSTVLLETTQRYGQLPRNASPATRAVLSALGDGPATNPDKDSQSQELSGAMLTSMAVYLSLLPLPTIDPPHSPDLRAAWRDGLAAFDELGCPSCHKPSWQIREPVWVEYGEDESSHVAVSLDLRKDIRNGPPLRQYNIEVNTYAIFPFTDLRRHDMGPSLADATHGHPDKSNKRDERSSVYRQGPEIPASYFMTRPLWGLADSAPYMHDGRAPTLHDAILQHGGEAQKSRDDYAKLPPQRMRALQMFLFSLTRPLLPEVTL